MSRAGLALAWTLSVAPLALEAWGVASLGAGSRLGWVLLPWLAWSGLPRSARDGEGWLRGWAAALPVLAAGAGLDLAQGRARTEVVGALAVGALLVALLAAAAALAPSRGAGRGAFFAAWLAVVPLPAAWTAAVVFAPQAAGASFEPPGWCLASPLVWVAGWTGADPWAPFEALSAVVPLAAAGLLLVVARTGRRGSSVGEA